LGFVCLLSLFSRRPVMFRIALETMGEDTDKGRAFADLWQYASFRRIFRVITVVWGLVFLAESAAQAVIVETASINTAKQSSNLLPVAVLVLTFVWTRNYGRRAQERGGRDFYLVTLLVEAPLLCHLGPAFAARSPTFRWPGGQGSPCDVRVTAPCDNWTQTDSAASGYAKIRGGPL
ncbi:MAG: hypothetical protein ABSA91_18310, partial [Acidimicrobiales bacterium]